MKFYVVTDANTDEKFVYSKRANAIQRMLEIYSHWLKKQAAYEETLAPNERSSYTVKAVLNDITGILEDGDLDELAFMDEFDTDEFDTDG